MKEYYVINVLEGIYEDCVRDNDKEYMERNLALTEAVKALTEIQQYREIEAEIKEQYHANVDIKKLMRCFIETIFKGEKHEGFCILTNDDAKMWQKYREIGTVEECREAMNKQAAKIPINLEYVSDDYSWEGECPCCGAYISENKKYCQICGQHLKWSKP